MAPGYITGTYPHNIDPKGRVTIPSKFRDIFAKPFTLGLNNEFTALALYPEEEMLRINEQLDRIPLSDAQAMAYVRLMRAFSFVDQRLDTQGRLLLPPIMREKAHLDKAIFFVGVGPYLEIWDADRFNGFVEETQNDHAIQQYANDRYLSKAPSSGEG